MAMENLPDELLIMIFEYIGAPELSWVTSRVCRKWQDLIENRIVILRRTEQCEELHMGLRVILMIYADDWKPCARLIISKAIELTPRLRELTLSVEIPLRKGDFRILRRLIHLRHLDVFAKREFLDEYAVINKNIKSLVVNEPMSIEFLESLQNNKLTDFHMYGRAKNYMPKPMENFLTIQAPYLRDITLRCQEMTDKRYEVVAQCVNLVALQLYSCCMMTKKGFIPIMGLKQLRRLHITGTTMLRVQGLLVLVGSLPPSLVDVNLSASRFGEQHAAALAARLPALRRLQLWRCALPDRPLLKLARSLALLEDLDTDILLQTSQIKALERHRKLRSLRCRWLEAMNTHLQLSSALQTHPREFLLDAHEGPAADLFYFWLRDVPLPAVQRRALASPPTPPHATITSRAASPTPCCSASLFSCPR